MLTLDERIRKVLDAVAEEPTKTIMLGNGDGDWGSVTYHDGGEECVFCGSSRKYKHGRMVQTHYDGCVVKIAKSILADHPED